MANQLEDQRVDQAYHLEQIIKVMQLNEMVNIQMAQSWKGNLGQWYYDVITQRLYINPVMMMVLGLSIQDIPTYYDLKDFLSYVEVEDGHILKGEIEQHVMGLSPVLECTFRLIALDQKLHHIYINGRTVNKGNEEVFIVGEAFDVTSQTLSKKEKKSQPLPTIISATLDPLTQLLSKTYIEQQLQRSITLARAGQENFCLLLIDLDFFKNINIHFGRDKGDEVLKEVGKILLKETRQTDYIGRVGGNQFLLILTDVDFKTGQMISERIRKAMANRMFIDGIRITVSGGLVNFDQHSYDHLIEDAKKLLKKSKTSGHNRMSY